MAADSRAVTRETFGAWLIKASHDLSPVGDLIDSGFTTVEHWCVRPTYRTELIDPDQLVLFWVSGGSASRPSGIYAIGRTTDAAVNDEGGRTGLSMQVRLHPLSTPVFRADLSRDPVLSQIEVLRMPAGSNPSFLTRAELAALESGWPQVAQCLVYWFPAVPCRKSSDPG